MTLLPPAPNPCRSCPYRTDVPSGIWHEEEYEKLREYDAPTGDQPLSLFLCHQTDAEDERTRLCAGWVGCHGGELLALRIAVAQGRFPVSVFDYTTSVPLFESGNEAADHGEAEIDDPSEEAERLIAKIVRVRTDIQDR